MPEPQFFLPAGYAFLEAISRHANRVVLRCARTDRPGDPTAVREERAASGGRSDPPVETTILKCLCAPFSDEELSGFRGEYLLLDALDHPNWVRPRRFGPLPRGGWYLELEECGGVSFSAWSLRGWWPETLEVARQLLSGLESLHRLGYAQLDLSPGQILIEPALEASRGWGAGGEAPGVRPRVRLLDLGLAAPFGASLAGRGTPGYMAPELLASRRDWDGRADLYGLGSILFELFTGSPAFPGEDVSEVLRLQTSGEVPDPGPGVGLPPPVRALVRELLDPEPGRRPTSALEVWQRLREQAPRERVGSLPSGLEPGRGFVFQGRGEEIAGFERWLEGHERGEPGEGGESGAGASVSGPLRCLVGGDEGIGGRRLVIRLAAVAQSRGWSLEGTATRSELFWPPSGALLRLERVDAEPGEPLRTASRVTVEGGAALLRIDLGPLGASESERILQGQGMEAAALRRVVAAESLGVPGRMASLVAAIPREVDLAARYIEESVAAEALSDLAPPADWVAQAGRWLRAVAAEDRDLLVALSLLEPGGTSAELAGEAQVDAGRVPAVLDPLVRRGLVKEEAGRWAYRSALWARAVADADGERRDRIGRRMLARSAGAGGPLGSVGAFHLALRLGEVATAERLLGPALAQLEEAGRLEDALSLWSSAARSGLDPELLYSEAIALPLLLATFPLDYLGGELLPPPTSMPTGRGSSDPERILRAWAAIARRQGDVASRTLHASASSRRGEFLRRWFQIRTWVVQRETAKAEAGIEALIAQEASHPGIAVGFWARVLLAMCRSSCAQWDAAKEIYRNLDAEMRSIPEVARARVCAHRAHVEYQSGDIASALRSLRFAGHLARQYGLQSVGLSVANMRASLDFYAGTLSLAELLLENLVWRWTARSRWDDSSMALVNLCLVFLERGRMGDGLRAMANAEGFAQVAADEMSMLRVRAQRVHALNRSGFATRAIEEATAFLGSTPESYARFRRLVTASCAEASLALGLLEAGRRDFRRAINEFRDAGGSEDAKETMLFWALRELEGPEPTRGRDLLAEARGVDTETSALTLSLEALVAGEVALLDRSRGDAAAELLRRAVDLLDGQDRWSLSWRAHWKLAEALEGEGQARAAAAEYATARSVLTSVVESFGKEAPVGPFLELPAVRRFLARLDEG